MGYWHLRYGHSLTAENLILPVPMHYVGIGNDFVLYRISSPWRTRGRITPMIMVLRSWRGPNSQPEATEKIEGILREGDAKQGCTLQQTRTVKIAGKPAVCREFVGCRYLLAEIEIRCDAIEQRAEITYYGDHAHAGEFYDILSRTRAAGIHD